VDIQSVNKQFSKRFFMCISLILALFLASCSNSTFTTGDSASIVLSAIDFDNAGYLSDSSGDGLLFNHPKGIASDDTRLILADTHNNRVLIWNTIPTADNTVPDLVLGQTDFLGNDSGRGDASTGLDMMNWPTSVAIYNDNSTVMLAVADAYNDRVLVWTSWPISDGQAADFALTGSDLAWPWGVWTDSTSLMVSSTTPANKVLVWDSFPTSNTTNDWDFSSNSEMGTPRSIVSDGSTFLAVADHNPDSSRSTAQGSFAWASDGTGLPTSASDHASDCFMEDATDANFAWLQGDITKSSGLYMIGRTLHYWSLLPTSGCDSPDASISSSSYNFEGGDGSDLVAVDSDGDGTDDMLFVSLTNGNKVVGYSTMPTSSSDVPDLVLGSADINTNTLDDFYITNPVPACDGTNLYVSSDFDRNLHIWTSYPTSSGQAPDDTITLSDYIDFAPWDNALNGTNLVLAGQTKVAVWTTLPTASTDAPTYTYTSGSIGSATFSEIRGVALDDNNLYIADKNNEELYIWDITSGFPSDTTDPDLTITFSSAPTRLSSDGFFLAVTFTEDHSADIYRIDDLSSAVPAPIVTVGGSGTFNLPEQVIISNGAVIVADTSFGRVLMWSSLLSALAGNSYDIILGENDASDTTPEVAVDKLFWPGALAYDGDWLWVGEYKFSGRIVGFQEP
jgi:hypothetical protein